MATTNDFITTFRDQVYTALQATGSKLLSKVTVYNGYSGISGSTVQFPKIQKAATPIINKGRGTLLSFGSNVVHDANVSTTLSSVYASELIDNMDQLRTNVNLQSSYAEALANAVGRGIDSLIVDELIASGTVLSPGGSPGTYLTALTLYKACNDAVMPMDRRRLVLNAAGWHQLFTSAPATNLMISWQHNTATGEIDNFIGFNAIPLFDPQSYTPDSTDQLCWVFHQPAVALAMAGTGIEVSFDRVGERDAMMVSVKALVGPKVLDPNAVFNVTLVTPE